MNQENFNTQGSNGLPNNQPLNNQNLDYPVDVNQQSINLQQQTMNTFESGNTNSPDLNNQQQKKKNIGLIIGLVIIVAIGCVGALLFLKKPSTQVNNGTATTNNTPSNNSKVSYNDSSRNIKSTYTFDEAVSQFAFKKNETTLIFKQKDNIRFSNISFLSFSNIISFYYGKSDATFFNFLFEESDSTNLNTFVTNFKNGILGGGNKQLSFENINILESNDEHVFISCQESGNPSYYYYFAKQIGNKVFYATYNSLFEADDATKLGKQVAIDRGKAEMLKGFKELFDTLSTDDGKEPYICDKIMNVPIVLNKQIKNYEFINSIKLVHPNISTEYYRDYMKGIINLNSSNSKTIELHYDAENLYNRINWSKDFTSKIKYTEQNNYFKVFGIKDNNITQVFRIEIDEQIDDESSFNKYLDNFFN